MSGEWIERKRLLGETYPWPTGVEQYDPYIVYESNGLLLGVGRRVHPPGPALIWIYKMSDDLRRKTPARPFVAADDYETTGEMLSYIKGKGPALRQMFGPGDPLPTAYDSFRIEIAADRRKGAHKKYCVVAHKDDVETMLRHSAIQVQLRGL